MSKKNSNIFDLVIGLIPLFILIYLEPNSIFIFILFFFIYVLYLTFKPKIKYIWDKYILKEFDNNKRINNHISNLKTSKTVTRRAKKGGYETLDFEFKYNPNVENFNLRLFAKIIDIIFYYFLIYLLIKYYKDFNINILFVSFLLIFIISPIFETLTGRTIGKLLTGLQVVDDNCEYPYILKSYAKNFLQIFNIALFIISWGTIYSDDLYFHNKKTKTYTIHTKEKKNIIKMLNENDRIE